ncbi:MAG: hypothetical protein JXQ73_26010 [Phycisphaerae bacterium]|nr:hypothetical protein [Phycisphaerae bacterium]
MTHDEDRVPYPVSSGQPESAQESTPPPAIQIFTLGGSTTFGYHVSHEHTWPSHLSNILNDKAQALGIDAPVVVTNYGRTYYDPSQETALLQDLLRSGHRPSLVIFMDGINGGTYPDVPFFTADFERALTRAQHRDEVPLMAALSRIPLVRLADSIRSRLNLDPAETHNPYADVAADQRVRHLVNRFEQNRAISNAVCALYGVRPMFCLQPDPWLNYPMDLYRSQPPTHWPDLRRRKTDFYAQLRARQGYINLTNLLEQWGPRRKAVIDNVHYSPNFNQFLATRVAQQTDLSSLANAAPPTNEKAATGPPETSRSDHSTETAPGIV